eukprot:CAMPEP_0118926964 /NCGR_PEP_ID=MMETSP1169-20130426/4557_1 /TAXON_ID=36882 /ORGANISM="Pyramimonas obovata, Strain CCMP722" /LENGTH=39 /DNA_ID= /DNA_START= /DNA_END= /DNA_ORIENTATION=
MDAPWSGKGQVGKREGGEGQEGMGQGGAYCSVPPALHPT